MANVFISYSSKDRDKASALAAALEDYGMVVWWDGHLVGGDNFKDKIDEHLSNAHAVIVLLTDNALKSDWVKAETLVGARNGNVVPVRYAYGVKGFAEIRELHVEFLGDWDGHPRARPIANLVQRICDLKSDRDRTAMLDLMATKGLGKKVRESNLVKVLFDLSLHGGLRVRTLAGGAVVCALVLWARCCWPVPATCRSTWEPFW